MWLNALIMETEELLSLAQPGTAFLCSLLGLGWFLFPSHVWGLSTALSRPMTKKNLIPMPYPVCQDRTALPWRELSSSLILRSCHPSLAVHTRLHTYICIDRKARKSNSFNPSEVSSLGCPQRSSVAVAWGFLCHCLVQGLSGTCDLVTAKSHVSALSSVWLATLDIIKFLVWRTQG